MNFARGGLVVNKDVLAAIEAGKVAGYTCDFADEELLKNDKVICLPHLGASTPEAEDNCAIMAVKELMEKFGEEFFDSDEFIKFFDFESYEKEVAKSYWLIDLRVSPMTIMTYAVKKCW